MGHGLGKIQHRILSVLDELKRRDQEDWFTLRVITIFLYTPWQLDPHHERNRGIVHFEKNWDFGKNEARRVWESVKGLEKRGLVECRMRYRNEGRIGGIWGGWQKLMQVRKK